MCRNMIFLRAIWFLLLALVWASCRKDNVEPDRYNEIPTTGTSTEKVLDSLYMYAKEVWLWQQYLPDYGAAKMRSYANLGVPNAYNAGLYFLLSPVINPATGQPFEKPFADQHLKYSYLTDPIAMGKALSALSSNGQAEDMGFEAAQYAVNDVRVAYVMPGSSASARGMQRGDRILEVDGRPMRSIWEVNRALALPMVELLLQRDKVTTLRMTVQSSVYVSDGIFKSGMLEQSGETLGYLAFSTFTNLPQAATKMESIMDAFASKDVHTLIIDLRYNRGGYLSAVSHLANLIAPMSLNGRIMYSTHYNSLMQQGKAQILSNQLYYDSKGEPVYIKNRRATLLDVDFSIAGNTQKFEKTGSLKNIRKLYFIVTGNTASASEMLINVFKPHLDVKVVGAVTYGKPVGFFGIKLDNYTLYLSSFLIKNSTGKGDYFDGFIPDIPAADDFGYDFGDVREASLTAALNAIAGVKWEGVEKRMATKGTDRPPQHRFVVSGFPALLDDENKLLNPQD